MISFFAYVLLTLVAAAPSGVRKVDVTSCEIQQIRLGLGMTTQLLFETEPRVTLYADKDHFQIQGTKEAPRALAIIPVIRSNEIRDLMAAGGRQTPISALIPLIDSMYKTNLFVFFEGGQQLMFELRFVPKERADYVVQVNRKFDGKCGL